ncbi:hypothetical protein [Nonomuraea sp. NPDC050202]|uniref:hypothetical protein n=1 Tax=Nonomuraea sp. NPDC050202 TaxID=3155035 RepID=UPI00340B6A90
MTTPDINERYVLVQDGMWMYYLILTVKGTYNPAATSATAYANGEPMTKLNVPGWWGTTSPGPHEIAVHIRNADRIVRWDLKDLGNENARFLRTLTPEEFNERSGDDDMWYSLYSAVREPTEPTIVPVDGPWIVLQDSPLPPDAKATPTWTAGLPTTLTKRGEYRHLFPGYLSGLRDHLASIIKRMPYVTGCYNQDQMLKVYMTVPLEVPEKRWVTPFTLDKRRRPKPVLREITVDRHLHLPVPDQVQGSSQADALKNWGEQVEHWTGVVESASVKACSACHGRGHVLDGAEEYIPAK